MSTIDDPRTSPGTGFADKLRAVEEDLARLRGARERMSAAGARLRDKDAKATGELTSRTSQDGLATVVCTGNGKVHRVELDKTGYNGVDEDRLCRAVVAARSQARQAALDRSAEKTTGPRQKGGRDGFGG